VKSHQTYAGLMGFFNQSIFSERYSIVDSLTAVEINEYFILPTDSGQATSVIDFFEPDRFRTSRALYLKEKTGEEGWSCSPETPR
jgi:hypothetical protein